MSDRSSIEWCDATWNPIRGCSRVSEGCRNCYAERIAARFGWVVEGAAMPSGDLGDDPPRYARMTKSGPRWSGEVRLVEKALDLPLRWRAPRRVFVNSMSDLFHEHVPSDWIDRIFAVMAAAHWHRFLLLTKRPERMRAYLAGPAAQRIARRLGSGSEHWSEEIEWPLANVHLGVSVEIQETADERIPLLLQTPAAVRFVSCEPMLAGIDLRRYLGGSPERIGDDVRGLPTDRREHPRAADLATPRLNWVIIGGESGPGARPCEIAWIRAAIRQCRKAGVPIFVKQLGRHPICPAVPRDVRGPGVLAAQRMIDLEWPEGTRFGNRTGDPRWHGREALLQHPRGADMDEWPDDLRVTSYEPLAPIPRRD